MFEVGDRVVYPHHGAAVIERREMKVAFGEEKEYLVLRLSYGDLMLSVPADNTDEVGLREVIAVVEPRRAHVFVVESELQLRTAGIEIGSANDLLPPFNIPKANGAVVGSAGD